MDINTGKKNEPNAQRVSLQVQRKTDVNCLSTIYADHIWAIQQNADQL